MSKDIFVNFIADYFKYCITCGEFFDELKYTNFIPVQLKERKVCDKRNYRPVSILANISKIYEKFVHNQLSKKYFDKLLCIS